jgi:hypothetical protein
MVSCQRRCAVAVVLGGLRSINKGAGQVVRQPMPQVGH